MQTLDHGDHGTSGPGGTVVAQDTVHVLLFVA